MIGNASCCDPAEVLDGVSSQPVSVPQSSQPRVLILQNDPCASLTLVRSIAGHGYLASGPLARLEEACAHLVQTSPDMVVMDVALEGGNTFDLARELRRKGIPFVFYTTRETLKQSRLTYGARCSSESPIRQICFFGCCPR